MSGEYLRSPDCGPGTVRLADRQRATATCRALAVELPLRPGEGTVPPRRNDRYEDKRRPEEFVGNTSSSTSLTATSWTEDRTG